MDIMIITNYCGDFSGNDNTRFRYLASILSMNHNVEIVTSSFFHPTKKQRKNNEFKWPFKVTFFFEPGYPKNLSLKRFYSHYIWGMNVAKYLKQREKPDVIYCAVPSLTGPNLVAKYCKKQGIRFVIDIQDLWPEAFQMVFRVPILRTALFFPFRWQVNKIYESADAVCAVSRTYADRALSVNRKCDSGTVVFLGTNLDTFDRNVYENKVSDKPTSELWLAYCGTLGKSYDLKCVIDALQLVEKKGYESPRFIVMGDGPQRAEFEIYAKEKGIASEFLGFLPYDRMCGLLKACDFAVNPIVRGAAQSIINKHGDYAAAGLAVLNTQESEEYKGLVNKYKMGFNCRNSDAPDLAEKLIILIKDKGLRNEMSTNARRCAEERFNRNYTYQELVDVICGNN